MVYVVEIIGMDYFKVGWSNDFHTMKRRIITLQQYLPCGIQIVFIKPNGTLKDERAALEALHFCIARGEWHHVTKRSRNFLIELKLVGWDAAIKTLREGKPSSDETRLSVSRRIDKTLSNAINLHCDRWLSEPR